MDVRDLPLIKKKRKYELRRGLTDYGVEHTIVWDGERHIDITCGLSFSAARIILKAAENQPIPQG